MSAKENPWYVLQKKEGCHQRTSPIFQMTLALFLLLPIIPLPLCRLLFRPYDILLLPRELGFTFLLLFAIHTTTNTCCDKHILIKFEKMGFVVALHHHHPTTAITTTTASLLSPYSSPPPSTFNMHKQQFHPPPPPKYLSSTTLSSVLDPTVFVGDTTVPFISTTISSSSSSIIPFEFISSTSTSSFLLLDDIHGQIISNAFDPSYSTTAALTTSHSGDSFNTVSLLLLLSSSNLPLVLSCIAGLSTCLGAGIVFVFDSKTITKYMSFILSLAASVMITVSVISIGPECLQGLLQLDLENNANAGGIGVAGVTGIAPIELLFAGYDLQVLDPMGLWGRIISFTIGCTSYWILSNFLSIPEPEDLLLQQQQQQQSSSSSGKLFTTRSTSSAASVVDIDSDSDSAVDSTTTTTTQRTTTHTTTATTKTTTDCKYSTSSSFPTTIARMTTMTNPFRFSTTSSLLMTTTTASSFDGGPINPAASSFPPHPPPSAAMTNNNSSNSNFMMHQSTSTVSPARSSSYQTTTTMIETDDNKNNNVLDHHDHDLGHDHDHHEQNRYWRVTLLLFISLLFHNFPEGLAVAASTIESTKLGLAVTIGILIHNIPEGIAIAVPCIAAFPDKPWLAFWLASASGLAEPIGALVALNTVVASQQQQQQLLSTTTTTTTMPDLDNVLACVAGIMCAVALLELYPEALRHQHQQQELNDFVVVGNQNNNNINGHKGTALILDDNGNSNNNNAALNGIDPQVMWGTIAGIVIMVTTELYLVPS